MSPMDPQDFPSENLTSMCMGEHSVGAKVSLFPRSLALEYYMKYLQNSQVLRK